MRTLVLNGDYRPITLVGVKRALILVLSEKAEVLEEGNDYFHSEKMAIASPKVIRLLRYVEVPFVRRIPVTRRGVLSRDDYTCGYCSGKATTVDHIVPRGQGGPHRWKNVVAACVPCNGRKGNRTPAQANMKLLIKPHEPQGKVALVVVAGAVDEAWAPYLAQMQVA